MAYLLGIDAGTTSIKVALFDVSGRTVASTIEEYRLETPRPDWVELDADAYWRSLKAALGRVLDAASCEADEIKALGISSQGETVIPVDENGRALRKAIVWLDNRSQEEATEIEEKFGRKQIFAATGSPELMPTWGGTKILWIKKHEPEVFKKTHKFLLLEDYLIYRLTGEFVGTFALYTSTLLVDIVRKTVWREMLDFIGISPSQLPKIVESGLVAGKVRKDAAEDLGLSTNTAVVTCGMDQACGSVGSGNIVSGLITETTGASLNICATVDRPVMDEAEPIPCQCHVVSDKYIVLPWCQTAGMVLKWFRDEFGAPQTSDGAKAGKNPYDVMTEMAAQVPPGSEGLVMLPHLAGAMCPEFDPKARGVFFNIGLDHHKAHFMRAILESVGFMLRRNIECVESLGIEVNEIRALGGAAESELWNTIKADILQKPVFTLKNKDTACLGAAILAGVASGVLGSISEACEQMISVERAFYPNPERRQIYDKYYHVYLDLYEKLAGLFSTTNS